MASKKTSDSRDEVGNKIPAQKKPTNARSLRAAGVERGSVSYKPAARSLRAAGIEKGNTAGYLGSKTMRTARSSGAEKMPARKATSNAQSLRAAGAKIKANKTPARSLRAAGAERMGVTGKRASSSLRARGIEKGGIKGPNTTTPGSSKSSSPQSLRARGAKIAANKNNTSSFRAQRFGKGKVGASAPAGRNKNQSIRAYEYKKKNPGKY